MDYKKIYNELCNSRKSRGLKRESGYEIHHILPRSMGGGNEENNLVKLTYKEHYLAHKLLCRFCENQELMQMQIAFSFMVSTGKYNIKNSDNYKSLKEKGDLSRVIHTYKKRSESKPLCYDGVSYIPLYNLIRKRGHVVTKNDIELLKEFEVYNETDYPLKVLEKINLLRIAGYLSTTDNKKGLIHYNHWYMDNKTRQVVISEFEDKKLLRLYREANKNLPILLESLTPVRKLDKCVKYINTDYMRVFGKYPVPDGLFIIHDLKSKRFMLVPAKFDYDPDKVDLYTKYCFNKTNQAGIHRLIEDYSLSQENLEKV